MKHKEKNKNRSPYAEHLNLIEDLLIAQANLAQQRKYDELLAGQKLLVEIWHDLLAQVYDLDALRVLRAAYEASEREQTELAKLLKPNTLT